MQESGRSVGGAEGFTVDREPRWSVGVTWRGFSFLLKEAKFLMALCIAQQSNPTCALYYEAFSYKTCFANDPGSSPDKKKGCRNGAVAQGSRTLKHFCLQECPVLCCSSPPPAREMDLLCPEWLFQGRSVASDLWWPWAGEESHLIPVLHARFSVCTLKIFTCLWNLMYKRDSTGMGWPSMQMITFLAWKLLLFLLCSAFGMKSMRAFQQSQY